MGFNSMEHLQLGGWGNTYVDELEEVPRGGEGDLADEVDGVILWDVQVELLEIPTSFNVLVKRRSGNQ
jgi:hypothetical protein